MAEKEIDQKRATKYAQELPSSSPANLGFAITREGVKFDGIKPKPVYTSIERATFENAIKFDGLQNLAFTDGTKLLSKFDGTVAGFLRESLTIELKAAIAAWYPELSARSMFPVLNKGVMGARHVKYVDKDYSGRARLAGTQSTGMALVNTGKVPVYSNVYNFEVGAKFSIYDLQSAMLGQDPLETDLIQATKYAQELVLNETTLGNSVYEEEKNVPSLINQPEKMIKNSDLVGSAIADHLANINLLACTPEEFYDWLCAFVSVPWLYTKNKGATVDTVALPLAQAAKAQTLVYNVQNGDSVATVFLKNNPNIKQILAVPELEDNANISVDGLTPITPHKDIAIAYRMSSDIADIVTTNNYTILPTYTEGATQFIIPTTQGFAGLHVYKKAIAMVENCGTP